MVSWVPVCNRTKRVCLFLSLSSCTVDFLVKAAEFDVGKEGIDHYKSIGFFNRTVANIFTVQKPYLILESSHYPGKRPGKEMNINDWQN